MGWFPCMLGAATMYLARSLSLMPLWKVAARLLGQWKCRKGCYTALGHGLSLQPVPSHIPALQFLSMSP